MSGPASNPHTGDMAELALIFRLNGEAFALSVDCVQEILDPIPMTMVPGAPPFAPALVNVRGAVAPVLDIRRRLGMQRPARDAEAAGATERFIVIESAAAGETVRLAIVADAVEEVIETDLAALEPVPELGARWPARFVAGVAQGKSGAVVLLDAEALFKPDAQNRPTAA